MTPEVTPEVRVEWVDLGDGRCVVASPVRAWLHRSPLGQPDPFAEPMTTSGTPATTGHLLDGAIAAGLSEHRAPPAPPMDPLRWAWHLVSYYHLTTRTPALLEEAEARFEAAGWPTLATWARDKRREETGHDQLALRDLRALGYDADALVAAVTPPVPRAMVEAFAAAAAEPLPLGVIAYAHTVERLALTLDRAHVDSIKSCLPAGVNAVRCLHVHSAIGSDAGHVAENVALVAALPADARRLIALACRGISAIWSASQSTGRADSAELRDVLGRYRRSNGHEQSN